MESKGPHWPPLNDWRLSVLRLASPISLCCPDPPSFGCALQEIRNLHNEQLMGIRREEEMEMSDDDMEDAPDSKDSEDSGTPVHASVRSATLLSTWQDARWSWSPEDKHTERWNTLGDRCVWLKWQWSSSQASDSSTWMKNTSRRPQGVDKHTHTSFTEMMVSPTTYWHHLVHHCECVCVRLNPSTPASCHLISDLGTSDVPLSSVFPSEECLCVCWGSRKLTVLLSTPITITPSV